MYTDMKCKLQGMEILQTETCTLIYVSEGGWKCLALTEKGSCWLPTWDDTQSKVKLLHVWGSKRRVIFEEWQGALLNKLALIRLWGWGRSSECISR